jgi:uncharacterized protein with von Willebrand factor type A (vWA) domain
VQPGRDLLRNLVMFGHVLREAGLEVGPGRLSDALRGLDEVDLTQRDDVYWTLRQTLVSRAEHLEIFDTGFAAWFEGIGSVPGERSTLRLLQGGAGGEEVDDPDGAGDETVVPGWSYEEVLRRKDFALLREEELADLRRLVGRIAAERPLRLTRRLRRHHAGTQLDMRGLVRASLGTGGEPLERAFRRRKPVPRKLVVLCDVSGSMEPYARALLLFAQALVHSGRGAETFAFGTRLTRLTTELRSRDPEETLAAASERVVDWAGGTRIGASLKQFNDEWGRRAMSRGAVVVIVSDGWERGDPGLVGREMARLARAAYAVVWVNPLKGDAEYQPLAGGMRAALPYVDRFLSGQNLIDLEELAAVLRGIERRHAA